MLDRMDLGSQRRAGERRREQLGDRGAGLPVAQAPQHQAEVRPLLQDVAELPQLVGAAVLVDRDMVDVAQARAGFREAIGDRLRGKAGPVLDAPEPFLLGGGDQHAVADQARRGVGVERVDAENDHLGSWRISVSYSATNASAIRGQPYSAASARPAAPIASQRGAVARCGDAQALGEAVDGRRGPPAALARLELRPGTRGRRQHRRAVRQRLGERHAKALGVARQHEEVGARQQRRLGLAGDGAGEADTARQAGRRDARLDLASVPGLVGAGDDEAPAGRPNARPGLHQHRQALDRIDAAKEHRRHRPIGGGGAGGRCGLGKVDPVRDRMDRRRQPHRREVRRFGVRGGVQGGGAVQRRAAGRAARRLSSSSACAARPRARACPAC